MTGFAGSASWSSPVCRCATATLSFFAQQLVHMLGEDVDLDVNPITGLGCMPRVVIGQRMGNEHDREGIGPDVDQCQANAVDGDRSLGYEQGGPGRIDFECEEFPLALLSSVAERGGRVDMALNEMSSQAVADLERALEIDAIAGVSGLPGWFGRGFPDRPGRRTSRPWPRRRSGSNR